MAKEKEERSWGEIVVDIVLVVPGLMWKGFVFQKLWTWYLMPLGAPPISLWQGLGIWLMIHYSTLRYDGRVDTRPKEGWVTATIIRWTLPAAFLLSGWLYNKFA